MKTRIILFYGALLTVLYLIPSFCEKYTDGFSMARIQSKLPLDVAVISPAPLDLLELDRALSQPYKYLGYGGQCYAFVSEDNQYVIKFFKTYFYQPKELLYHLPLPQPLASIQLRHCNRAKEKLIRDFSSYCIAWEDLREETGLIYLHLAKTNNMHKNVHITDKLNIAHVVNLDEMEFAVQKRAQLVYDHITELMTARDVHGAKLAIRSLVELVKNRAQKGCHDEDAKIHRNFGFIGSRAAIIDIGRFVKDPNRKNSEIYRRDLKIMTARFRVWLEQVHPTLTPYLDEILCEI